MTESALVASIKAGGFAALITLFFSDVNMMMVLITGLTGGIAFFFKEYTHLPKEVKENTTRFKIASEFAHMVPMAIATAGVVIFAGIDGINQFFHAGEPIWWFFGLMAALNYKHVVKFFAAVGAKFIRKKAEK